MAQPDLVTDVVVAKKISAAKKRVSAAKSLTHIDGDDAVHIVLPPEISTPDPLDAKLAACFANLRHHFKCYNTKAKHHLNSSCIRPELEQQVIEDRFNNDAELKQLMKYLNIALNEFSYNLKRFMKDAQNSDYQPVFSPQNDRSANMSIKVKNAKGRQAGPFLLATLCQDNHDGYTRLNVSVGYVGKRNRKIVTHSFAYDPWRKPEMLTERRGDKEYLKTEQQVLHDESCEVTLKELRTELKYKHR